MISTGSNPNHNRQMIVRGSYCEKVEKDKFSLFLLQEDQIVEERHDLSWPTAFKGGLTWLDKGSAAA